MGHDETIGGRLHSTVTQIWVRQGSRHLLALECSHSWPGFLFVLFTFMQWFGLVISCVAIWDLATALDSSLDVYFPLQSIEMTYGCKLCIGPCTTRGEVPNLATPSAVDLGAVKSLFFVLRRLLMISLNYSLFKILRLEVRSASVIQESIVHEGFRVVC